MNFINKEDVAFFEVRQKPSEVGGFFNRRAARGFDIRAHRLCQNICNGRFSQTRRAAQ